MIMVSSSKLSWPRVLKSVLLGLVVITGSLSISADLYISFHYAAAMPRTAQPETGRVYPVPAQYGGTVYVTQGELKRREFVRYDLTYIFGSSVVLYACFGTTLGWWPFSLKSQESAKLSKHGELRT
jgi:hypothetical protein